VTVAGILQDYILNLRSMGIRRQVWKVWVALCGMGKRQVMELGTEGISMMADPAANERCRWWQLGWIGITK